MKHNKFIRKINLMIRGVVNALIFKLYHRKGFDHTQSFVICGSSRSGSTWIAEIICSIPGHSQIFEPLNTQYVKQASAAGVRKNMFLNSYDQWDSGKLFLEKIFSGKLINPWLVSQIPFRKVLFTKRLVIKFVRANLILGWICENFSIYPPVLVIRHPCAIICSQMNKGWTPSKVVLLSNPYFKGHPLIHEQCQKLSLPEEINALAWCLRYHAPLFSIPADKYILICYEKLVRDGVKELKKLFDAWGLEMTDSIYKQLKTPSDTVTQSSQIVSGLDSLAGWRKKLTPIQVDNILAVLDIFSMSFYTTDLEPNYKLLYNLGK